MLRHKNIDRICAVALAATLLLTCGFMGAASLGWVAAADGIGEVTASNDFNRGVPGDMLSNIGGFPGGGSASGNEYTYQIVLFAGSVLVLIAGLIFAWKFKSNL